MSSVAIALTLGIILGRLAGYYEGTLGGTIMRGMDIILSFLLVILALGIIAMLGPSMTNLIITIGVVYTPTFVRLVNGSVDRNLSRHLPFRNGDRTQFIGRRSARRLRSVPEKLKKGTNL